MRERIVDPRLHIPCEHCSWLIPTGELHECEICGKEHTADETWLEKD
jgi:rRNA maturation endonuclease Nob1